jgi:hypothetical protein
MVTLLSGYILHSTKVGRVAGVSKELAVSIFDFVQDQDASFFVTQATQPSAHFEKANKC